MLHGAAQDGLSQKGAGKGHASHYYSLTRLKTEGVLHTSEGVFEVESISWMDHELGSSQLTKSQVGWDWFPSNWRIITNSCCTTCATKMAASIRIPTLDLTLHLEPVLAAQELVTDNSTRVTYWEGSVTVRGSLQRLATEGVGYVELTGYVQRVNL